MKITRPNGTDPRFVSPSRTDGTQRQAPTDRVSHDAARVAVSAAKSREEAAQAERLKRLEAAVRDGTYRPDPAQIADRLIESSSWLGALDNELEQLEQTAGDAGVVDASADR